MRFISLSFLILLGSCGSQENKFVLTGKADVVDGTKIYVLQADQNNQPYIKDSTTVQSNNFKFQGISSTPQISYIQVEGVNGYVLAILENGDIKADLFKDSISKSKVYGTKSNDDFIKYKSETKFLVDDMNNIADIAQDAIMTGDVATAMELEKEYNSKEREVMLYEWDFIVDNLDSYNHRDITIHKENIIVPNSILPFREEGRMRCLPHKDEGIVAGKFVKGETTARNERRYVLQMQQNKINYKDDGLKQVKYELVGEEILTPWAKMINVKL